MSLRSLKIPGQRLGLGCFANTDVDAKKRLVLFGFHTWTAGSTSHAFTQGQTRMAEIESVILSKGIYAALASASVVFSHSTLTNGTVTIRLKPKEAATNTNKQALGLHYWIVGTPDPNRVIL